MQWKSSSGGTTKCCNKYVHISKQKKTCYGDSLPFRIHLCQANEGIRWRSPRVVGGRKKTRPWAVSACCGSTTSGYFPERHANVFPILEYKILCSTCINVIEAKVPKVTLLDFRVGLKNDRIYFKLHKIIHILYNQGWQETIRDSETICDSDSNSMK